jgi:hypothetical protein
VLTSPIFFSLFVSLRRLVCLVDLLLLKIGRYIYLIAPLLALVITPFQFVWCASWLFVVATNEPTLPD